VRQAIRRLNVSEFLEAYSVWQRFPAFQFHRTPLPAISMHRMGAGDHGQQVNLGLLAINERHENIIGG